MLKKLLGLTLAICFAVPVLAVPAHSDHWSAQDNVVEIEELCQHFLKDSCSEKELIDYLHNLGCEYDETGKLSVSFLPKVLQEVLIGLAIGSAIGLSARIITDLVTAQLQH